MQNHFELFNLPQQFAVDAGALDSAYRDVQSRVHPDKFVNATDAEKRVAMQWATRANEAYQTLKNPQKRAQYMCELNGVDLQTESNTSMPMAFLMQQMEWRESLDDASDVGEIDGLQATVDAARARALSSLDWLIDEKGDFVAASQQVRALMFIERFAEDVEARTDQWGQ